MRFASVAEVKNQLSRYLADAKRRGEPIVVTHHGKPYALIQPISEADLDELGWKRLSERQLRRAWEGAPRNGSHAESRGVVQLAWRRRRDYHPAHPEAP